MIDDDCSNTNKNDKTPVIPKLALPAKKGIYKNYPKTERGTDYSISESQRSARRRKNIFTREGPTYNLNDTITKELKRGDD